jgi:LDH2 family malate/lactate/ureidoglycolate dehydrogenase
MQVTTLIHQLRASELVQHTERIILPGELEYIRRETRLQDGIPLTEEAITVLQAVANDFGLELAL